MNLRYELGERDDDRTPVAYVYRSRVRLPNPAGRDEGNEQVVIRNATNADVDLDGWSLRDRAGNVFWLTGTVPTGEMLTITMREPTMPLNNDGDEVVLIDGSGVVRSRVTCAEGQAEAWIAFGKSASGPRIHMSGGSGQNPLGPARECKLASRRVASARETRKSNCTAGPLGGG